MNNRHKWIVFHYWTKQIDYSHADDIEIDPKVVKKFAEEWIKNLTSDRSESDSGLRSINADGQRKDKNGHLKGANKEKLLIGEKKNKGNSSASHAPTKNHQKQKLQAKKRKTEAKRGKFAAGKSKALAENDAKRPAKQQHKPNKGLKAVNKKKQGKKGIKNKSKKGGKEMAKKNATGKKGARGDNPFSGIIGTILVRLFSS